MEAGVGRYSGTANCSPTHRCSKGLLEWPILAAQKQMINACAETNVAPRHLITSFQGAENRKVMSPAPRRGLVDCFQAKRERL
jgi:hypothetical protein